MIYDYLIVGAGLYGAVVAHELSKDKNAKILVIDKRNHIGGNIYCEKTDGIHVHKYGAHIFHTSNKNVWDYVNQFVEFNNYINSPVANYKGELYNLPFNMNTFTKMWADVKTPEDAQNKIESQRLKVGEPKNLEEQAKCLVGDDIYLKLVKGYTEKQWGRDCSELPAFIIKRLPLRFTFNNNYFNDRYQGIPINGYNELIEKLLNKENIKVLTSTSFNDIKNQNDIKFKGIIYTGTIDEYYNYQFGKLEYRSLEFKTEKLNTENYQGVAVMNFTDRETPYTRIIEHKWFNNDESNVTYITREYPADWTPEKEPYYPINDEKNNSLYQKYKDLSDKDNQVFFGGRLGKYKYYDILLKSMNLLTISNMSID